MATITTLIPAYKKEFLAETFRGLQRQRFRDFRVILSDDSPGDEITRLIREGHFASELQGIDLQVVRGPKSAHLNLRALIDLWNERSPLVHIQLDDDVIFPDFYRQHVEAHASGRYSTSVSRRWITGPDGVPHCGYEQPPFVDRSPLRFVPVDAGPLFASTVRGCVNWLGEFSNMVLSAEGARNFPRPPANDLSYFGLSDVGYLLTAVQHAPIVIVRDHLGIFRQHPQQTTHHMHNHDGRVTKFSFATWALLAWREGRLTYEEAANAISITVRDCLNHFGETDPVANEFFDIVQREGRSLAGLLEAYKAFWLRLLASNRSTAPAGAVAAARPAPASAPVPAPAPVRAPLPPAMSEAGEAAALAAVRRAMDALIPG
jgi:hypothetical protein